MLVAVIVCSYRDEGSYGRVYVQLNRKCRLESTAVRGSASHISVQDVLSPQRFSTHIGLEQVRALLLDTD